MVETVRAEKEDREAVVGTVRSRERGQRGSGRNSKEQRKRTERQW